MNLCFELTIYKCFLWLFIFCKQNDQKNPTLKLIQIRNSTVVSKRKYSEIDPYFVNCEYEDMTKMEMFKRNFIQWQNHSNHFW